MAKGKQFIDELRAARDKCDIQRRNTIKVLARAKKPSKAQADLLVSLADAIDVLEEAIRKESEPDTDINAKPLMPASA